MIRRFLRDSGVYVIPTLVSRGLGFLLLPVYTHFLSSGTYGALELLTLLYALLNLTLPLEITQAVARFMSDCPERVQRERIASTGYWFTFFGFSLAAAILLIAPDDVSRLLFGDRRFAFEIRLAAVAMMLNALQYVIQNQLRWLREARSSALVGIAFSVVSASVSICALWLFDMGLAGVIYGQIAGSAASLLLGHRLTARKAAVRPVFDPILLRKMLVFSAPLVFSNLGVYLATFADRWLINHLLGLDQVGVYSVAWRFASLVTLGVSVFQMAFMPLIYANHKEKNAPESIDRIVGHVLLVLIPAVAFLAVASPTLVEWMVDTRYRGAAPLIGWLGMAVLLLGGYVFFPGLWISGKTRRIAGINLVAAAVNVGANWLLIPILGLWGAVFGTLLGAIVMNVCYFLYSIREYPVPYRMGRYLGAMLGLAVTLAMLPIMPHAWQWGLWLLLCLAVVPAMLHFRDWAWLRQLAAR